MVNHRLPRLGGEAVIAWFFGYFHKSAAVHSGPFPVIAREDLEVEGGPISGAVFGCQLQVDGEAEVEFGEHSPI
jgi:hypothetical protein